MTPFGHIGGGLLVAVTAEKLLFKEEFSVAAVGMVIFLSILPDLDVILAFLFGSWKPGVKKSSLGVALGGLSCFRPVPSFRT